MPLGDEKERLAKIADELFALQAKENNGRGVTCVRGVAEYLRMGDLSSARAFCFTDHDKILNYPVLMEYIKKNLFVQGEEHPWSVLERLG